VAYDEGLAERVRDVIGARPGVTERKMFGGLGFMVSGNMACAVMGDDLIVRIDPEEMDSALREPHAGVFGRMGKRPMSGFVLVEAPGLTEDAELARWVDRGAERAASLPPK
jgi:TfoX/Sxy family transcriptional regulator of competence genes